MAYNNNLRVDSEHAPRLRDLETGCRKLLRELILLSRSDVASPMIPNGVETPVAST